MNELPLLVSLGLAAAEPVQIRHEASGQELSEIKTRLGISKILSLALDAQLQRTIIGDIYQVSGNIKLIAERSCIVTLENFIETTEGVFDEYFTTSPEQATDQSEQLLIDPDEDEVTLLEQDSIDIGELALQHLVLALNPYPRAPDAPLAAGDETTAKTQRPFAGLDALLAQKKAK
ncbi:MAG: DUF177 domain-containing protein [Rhodospirillales bacterium]|jgi:uncharacterized metal-binding protein YceD (DUF177 family)